MAEEEEDRTHYLIKAAGAAIIIGLVQWWWPKLIPFATFSVWTHPFSVATWWSVSQPMLVWALITSIAVSLLRLLRPQQSFYSFFFEPTPVEVLKIGFRHSLWAGITEEIAFRWLLFFGMMPGIYLVGIICLGIPEWFYLKLAGPFADWFSLGYLHPFLFHQGGWYVGASLLAANALFRDGHRYQGWFGWIDSWFFGMYCYWVTLNYGLPMAILLHISYNLIVYSVVAVRVALSQRPRSRRSLRTWR